jgi:hypothetical protein
MVEDLRAAFQELVTESDWMDSATQVSGKLTYIHLRNSDR